MAPARILVLGATGYTGDLTARSLVAGGARPVLVARNQVRVEAIAAELGDLESAVADISDPSSLRRVLEPGDVLISTVGPFLKYGRVAVQTAAEVGAHYLDSTGEGPFIREVFEKWGPVAESNDVALLPAFGYDFVPGALAGALALEEAGPDATWVEIAYFSPGFVASGGTEASTVRVLFEDNQAFRDGAIRSEYAGRHTRVFDIDGTKMLGASVPAAEHFGLPQSYPQLRDVTVMLSFPPLMGRTMAVAARVTAWVGRIGPLRNGLLALADRANRGSTGGPDAATRAKGTSRVIASAGAGTEALASVTLTGPNPYDVTADILAWGAMTAAAGGLQASGALGPVAAFGLDALTEGCTAAGMTRTPTS